MESLLKSLLNLPSKKRNIKIIFHNWPSCKIHTYRISSFWKSVENALGTNSALSTHRYYIDINITQYCQQGRRLRKPCVYQTRILSTIDDI